MFSANAVSSVLRSPVAFGRNVFLARKVKSALTGPGSRACLGETSIVKAFLRNFTVLPTQNPTAHSVRLGVNLRLVIQDNEPIRQLEYGNGRRAGYKGLMDFLRRELPGRQMRNISEQFNWSDSRNHVDKRVINVGNVQFFFDYVIEIARP